MKEDAIVVSIEDNGSGFLTKFPLFEPFHSTDPDSTGLGLTTVKELIEAHGGIVLASSSAMGGACIKMYIPLRR